MIQKIIRNDKKLKIPNMSLNLSPTNLPTTIKTLKQIVAKPMVKPLAKIWSLIYKAAQASTPPSVIESAIVKKTNINKIIGHNTDIDGFELGLRHFKYNVNDKKIFILGAGGVVSSIILALKKAGASEIVLSNRTKEKAENLKKKYSYLKVVDWGGISDSNIIINATSLGLKEDDEIKLNYADIGPNKLFYDIIYNPGKTKFLSKAKQFGNQIENGKAMFAYQAQLAFEIWHGIKPTIDTKILKLLDND